MILDKLKNLFQEPPPGLAFEISEAGISAARIGSRAEIEFQPLKKGTLDVSPLKENVVDPDDFSAAVRSLAGGQGGRKYKDVALILPDYSTRLAVLDFDEFPSDPKEQLPLVRFRLKRSVPFDVESAALSYFVPVSYTHLPLALKWWRTDNKRCRSSFSSTPMAAARFTSRWLWLGPKRSCAIAFRNKAF